MGIYSSKLDQVWSNLMMMMMIMIIMQNSIP